MAGSAAEIVFTGIASVTKGISPGALSEPFYASSAL
jgi:hypothetical protein